MSNSVLRPNRNYKAAYAHPSVQYRLQKLQSLRNHEMRTITGPNPDSRFTLNTTERTTEWIISTTDTKLFRWKL